MTEPTDTQRRAYLAKHGVEAAITAATTKVLVKRPAEPVVEVGRCLLDPDHIVPAGKAFAPALQYVQDTGITAAVAAAVKSVVKAMPSDPIRAIGAKLVPQSKPSASAGLSGAAAVLEKSLSKRTSVAELHAQGILKKPVEVKAEQLQHQMAADSLSKMLDRRPTLNELQSQHIYKSPVADKAEHLEHAKAADKLAKALESRHSIEELKDQHIFKSPVADKAEQLEHAKAADALAKKLESRHSAKELHDMNILKSAVEDKKHHLEDKQRRASLSAGLEKRASMEALMAKKIIKDIAHVTIQIKFGILSLEKATPLLKECVSATSGDTDCIHYGWTTCGKELFLREAYTSGAAAANHLGAVGGAYAKLLDAGALTLSSFAIMAPEKELEAVKKAGDELGATYWKTWDDWACPTFAAGSASHSNTICTINPTFTILNMEKAEPLMAQCMSGTKTEADCIYYGWAICDKKLFCREAYFSGKGVAAHLANVGDLVAKLLDDGAVKLDSIEVHGPPDQLRRCKSACEALGCSFWEAQGGFAKFATPTTALPPPIP